jgi:hypothetical protein
VSAFLTDAEMDLVMQAADALMPAEGLLPSVEDSEMREQYIDDALIARADCIEPLKEFAHTAATVGVIRALADAREEDGSLWEVVTSILPGAYFLSRSVRERLGYAGQTADRIDPEATPDFEELLGVVTERGAFYRPTPSTTATQSGARQL